MPISLRRSAPPAAFAALLLTAVTGCSSGSDDEASGLLAALGELSEDAGSAEVLYLDRALVREHGDAKTYDAITQPRIRMMSTYDPQPWDKQLKPSRIDSLVESSNAGRLKGSFDAAALIKSLKSDGYKQREKDGRQFWQRSGTKQPLFQVSDDEVSYSTGGADALADVDPEEGASLADKEDYQRVVECLGDVYRADVMPLTAGKRVRLSALGQRVSAEGRNTEVMCVVAKDRTTADRTAGELRSTVRDGAPKFDGANVTIVKGDTTVVRVTVPDSGTQRPGRLLTHHLQLWMALHDV
ncbi:hypothetical protein [Streptomyces sp. NPDC005907]|uniref:hypothetical protein n=1 Tax=Streptomyces sp. NPDC005907 TaxID=3154571 RepID=UPI0033DFCA46